MSEYITLYRVSFDTEKPLTRRYEPRVPLTAMLGEDKITPRVCFADSIEGCISAMPHDLRGEYFGEGRIIVVFSFRVEADDPALWTPEDLKQSVPDAEFTREYWYTEPVILTGRLVRIGEFAWGNYFFATEKDRKGVYKVLAEQYGFSKEELVGFNGIPMFDLVNYRLNGDPKYWEKDACLGDSVAGMLDIPNDILFDFFEAEYL